MSKFTGKLSMKKYRGQLYWIYLNDKCITKIAFKAYGEELVRRWNAFEEDGLVDDLLEACKAVKNIKNKIYGFDVGGVIKQVEAAIAKVS